MRNNRLQQKYYNDWRWKNIREEALRDNPICTCCNDAWATCVHHIVPFVKYITTDPEKAEKLCYDGNVAALCEPCHKSIHKLLDASEFDLQLLDETIKPDDKNRVVLDWVLRYSNTPDFD